MVADARLPTGVRTVRWEEDVEGVVVCLLDQSLLPHHKAYLLLRHEAGIARLPYTQPLPALCAGAIII
ncbi:MAG: hypothetical protein ABI234_08295 [Ktedonobacteraceae bacterium]